MAEELQSRLRYIAVLSKIFESFYFYQLRRTIGNLYIMISATIGVFLSISFFTELYLASIGFPYSGLSIFILMIVAFGIIIYMSSRYFKFIEFYSPLEEDEKDISWLWIPLGFGSFLYVLVGNIFNAPYFTYPLAIQLFVALGNLVNYYDARMKKPYLGKVEKEYLYYAFILFIGCIPIILLPRFGWFILTIMALLGAYVMGAYLVVSADKIFIEAGIHGRNGEEVGGDTLRGESTS